MKTLLMFSLKRRFKNRINAAFSALFILLVLGVFYADVLSDALQLDFNRPYEIVLDEASRKWIQNEDLWTQQGFVFTQKTGHLYLQMNEEGFAVSGKADLVVQTKIKDLLLKNHQTLILANSPDNVEAWLERYQNVQVRFDQEAMSLRQIKQQIIIVFLTSLYFMMLNFIAVNSNEIIAEKTSHFLALVLSSVSVTSHFLSKFVSGIVTITLQISSSILVIVSIGTLRYRWDEGKGLFKLISKYLPLPMEELNFKTLLSALDFGLKDLSMFILCLVFLLLGVALVQLLILILSSRVRTSEEAGAIQGPFYLILLVLYYGSL